MSRILNRSPLLAGLARRLFVRSRHTSFRVITLAWWFVVALILVACGQVVTVETPSAIPTPQATLDVALSDIPMRPTVTRALPTATKPNTPTPSPTPIVHVVQSGETLIAIALKYGVTVDALQSANGISDPSSLQVSQELIVPIGDEEQDDNSALHLPSPTPVAFPIEGLSCYKDPLGSLWCLGEVVNSTESSIENVQVRVTLHSAEGEELAGDSVFAALDLVLSGQRAPFGVLFTKPPEGFERFGAAPIRAEASTEPANRYAMLDLTGIEASLAGSLFQVSGSVTNPGQGVVTSVTVVVTTYDGEGRVTGFRQSRLSEDVPAGGSVAFAASLMPYDGTPANYTVAVQGHTTGP